MQQNVKALWKHYQEIRELEKTSKKKQNVVLRLAR